MITLLGYILQGYCLLIFIRILLTWVPNIDVSLPPIQMLMRLTDPVLDLARRYIPPVGMIDLSPTIVLIVLFFLSNLLIG